MQKKEQLGADLLNTLQSAFNLILNEHGLSIHERARLLEILRGLYGGVDREKWIDVKVHLRELEDLLGTLQDLKASSRKELDSMIWRLRFALGMEAADSKGPSTDWLKTG